MDNKMLHMVTFVLLAIGGLNWLLVVIGWDLEKFLGGIPYLMEVVYVLVGLSAIYQIATHKHSCKECEMDAPTGAPTGM